MNKAQVERFKGLRAEYLKQEKELGLCYVFTGNGKGIYTYKNIAEFAKLYGVPVDFNFTIHSNDTWEARVDVGDGFFIFQLFSGEEKAEYEGGLK